jgi:esterase/lipase superfamily enzyme
MLHRSRVRLLVALCLVLGAGCTYPQEMPPTPNVLRDGSGATLLEQFVPPEQRDPRMDIVYVTDRSLRGQSAIGPDYGFGRAVRMAFGIATVRMNPEPTWEQLVAESGTERGRRDRTLDVTEVLEVGRISLVGQAIQITGPDVSLTRESIEEIVRSAESLRGLIRERLAGRSDRDVYVYVHGFNNSFNDAAIRAAILWHSISRKGVFVSYTWPAGYGGMLGYLYDRESGEFTSLHLRELLKIIAKMPDVDRVHLIAHSRGTDVVTTALRELNIEFRARGLVTREQLKLSTLILAAPDLDFDVFGQRFFMENLAGAARQTVVYFSREDSAVAFSNWLFGGRIRLGTGLKADEFSPHMVEILTAMETLQFIECQVYGVTSSHAYVFGNPAALSDVIAVLRDGKMAGAEHGRPLIRQPHGVWLLTNDYFEHTGKSAAADR